jgi:alpha-L-rhamnosidase
MLVTIASPAVLRAALTVGRLRCEYQTGVPVIDSPTPRLSWTIQSDSRGELQSAYQIRVTRDDKIVWDSGQVPSDDSVNVEYGGEPLVSAQTYQWKVRVWDQKQNVSDWSAPGAWAMGLLEPADWHARWIMANLPASPPGFTNEPQLRRDFDIDGDVDSAIARVNVMGWYELYVNGQKVGADVISPGVTDYSKRSLYLTDDVKSYLHRGPNCIGLWLSRGWYWPGRRGVVNDGPIARLQLDLTVGGKPITIGTDSSWRCAPTGRAILGSWSVAQFGGELVIPRALQPKWCDPEFSDADWAAAREVASPAVEADAQRGPPDQVLKTIPAVSCTDLGAGLYSFDFGQNLTGFLSLNLPRLSAGHVVTIHYSDRPVTAQDNEVFNQRDLLISSGGDGDVFTNKFNYHGFRYATVEGLPSPPSAGDATALAIGAAWDEAGEFECSDPLINRMHEVDLRTMHSLSQGGYMSDCPHRERLGYGGDGQVSIDSCIMNFQMPGFYEKWIADWRDVQDPATGFIPHTAPQGEGGGGPPWGAALQELACRLNLYYGERTAINENYLACRRYVQMLQSHETDGLLRAFAKNGIDNLGDWLPPGPLNAKGLWSFPSPQETEFFNNCYLVYLLDQLGQMAGGLNRSADVSGLSAQADALRSRIQENYFDPKRNCYLNDKQAYLVMPLLAGVTPEKLRDAVQQTLFRSIASRGGHLDTGLTGTYFLIHYLQDIGRDDLLWTIVHNTSYPGWGYCLEQGDTTWPEQWDGGASFIHACFNSLDSWFYQALAGIRPDPSAPGFKKIVIKPAIVGDLAWVRAHYDCVYGRIVSEWQRKSGSVSMHVVIPANTMANVYVPARDAESVTEGGKPVAQAMGVKFVRFDAGAAIFEVGSGEYNFTSVILIPLSRPAASPVEQ